LIRCRQIGVITYGYDGLNRLTQGHHQRRHHQRLDLRQRREPHHRHQNRNPYCLLRFQRRRPALLELHHHLKLAARYYNPTTGRFTQPDPATLYGGYAYAGDNPTNNTDPTGLHFWTDLVGGVVAVVAGTTCSIGTALAGTLLCAGAAWAFGEGITDSLNFVVYGEEATW
jgi:RHS repeat-associated protein